MALGDLMAARFSQSSASLSNHLDEFSGNREDGDAAGQRRDSEAAAAGAATTSMAYLPQIVVLCDFRHEGFEDCMPSGPSESGLVSKWRPKDRMKTEYVALVLCLNIGVDPPDVIKISPCARMECWIDPSSMAAPKALETIGKALHAQYERWLPRARYKRQLDPTVEEVKKLCTTCRKYARSERVLFHYNGHGVPKPTPNDGIWVFNKSYTQYIPLPISDLDSWLKTPSIYVFDCSAAGMIVNAFMERIEWNSSDASASSKDCILLAACEAHETLPQSSEFPADVFTSCLTTPIQMALRWFCSRSLLRDWLDHSLIDQIPGRQNDRKTLLGELNWIFTAVTDTIAWNVLPHDIFQRLFRQDLLVASLFRNFLLAERIMRAANCSPNSYPLLPSTHQHHMWDAWDMAAEICLSKLPQLIANPNAEFQPSPFFTEQLTAFEVWLDHGSEHKKPPEQLPIVLQVLLSQSHRFRALVLLGRFLDMGPWAVDLALSVGIFPYVLKLLQTNAMELRQILVFIWTKILSLDKSCQVDLVKDGGHAYFIKFLDSMDAYPEQRAMAAFVLAVIVDGHRRGQEACIHVNLIHVCLRHVQLASAPDAQTEPLLLQWLCLCLGKLWEDFPQAQVVGLQADAPAMIVPLLSEPQPEVRAAAVFALGTLLDVGSVPCGDGHGTDEDCEEDEKIKAELNIVKNLLQVVGDGSPLVRAEVAVALACFAFSHNKHLKSIAAEYWKPQSNYLLSSLPSLANINCSSTGYANPNQYMHSGSALSSHIGPVLRFGSDSIATARDGRISTSSPLASEGIMHGSPQSDDSSQHFDSGILIKENATNGVINCPRSRPLESAMYSQLILAMSAMAKDPSPQIANLGRRTLSIIGIEQVVTRTSRFSGGIYQVDSSAPSASPNLAGLARSSSWFDMNAGHLPKTFRTPPVSPPQNNFLTGSAGSSGGSERSLLPQSTIYNWSCGHFSRPLLTAADDNEEMMARSEERERIALNHIAKCQHSSMSKFYNPIVSLDAKFATGTKATLLLPFSPIVVAADENECIRVWNYEEGTTLNSFENHDLFDRGISRLCLVNELDDSLLLVASSDGNVRVWKDYTLKGKQKLVTAFSSVQGHRPGVRSMNAVVDWQQQSGYLYASGEASSIVLWDLDKEQLVSCIPSSSDSSISALSASQVHGGLFAAGFVNGSIRIFDIRTPEMPIYTARPHTQGVERVVEIGFQPGLDPDKIVSASQAGDIQFLDIRNQTDEAYVTIDAHRGSLTALAIHRHAPVIASGSAKPIVKVFSLEGEQLSIIRYSSTFMAQRTRSVSCLTFHPYRVLLAAGAADACVSIHADDSYQAR
ncbi:regulatory-associated protein of TOR 1-like isoform X2 [Phoenix dactylifera]|uniref:Regulatory-associated protein of TOR 1-like isoform X2 n=1 Tax=Phoenix dactylifera TaxID=42345 RepID=A0A8B7CID1_PHODC|nr:regulatory-associated protein of TOR 1-like isoform X2 [Phoenix dactylifera]